MPLDIRLFRDDKTLNEIRESERKRFSGDEGQKRVDDIVQIDQEWRQKLYKMEIAKRDKNNVSKEIGKKKKAKEDATNEQEKAKELGLLVVQLEKEASEAKANLDKLLPMVGNIVHESVVFSNDEEKDNKVEATYGEASKPEGILPHNQVLYRIGGYEPERGSKVAGQRGYFLTGPGVMLNQALIAYSLQFLTARGYNPVQPPYFMKKSVMGAVAQLSDFDEALYHVGTAKQNQQAKEGEKTSEKDKRAAEQAEEDGSKYLIATSEQPLCAYHMGDWFRSASELPIKYAGVSTCFRKEAGKAGKDTWGIFRVHQFDKIEQFVLTEPSKSWEAHEEMRKIAEDFLQSLKIPYRVVNIVSGELNLAASKKYDIEAWFPCQQEYKELVSCSNCLDYQSRAVDVRFGPRDEKLYVHMLNSTLCALTRTISCILTNFQDEGGVKVPEVLVPFMGGTTYIPFIREEQKFTVAKKGGK